MSVLISLPLRDGGSIIVEAPEELAPAGVVRASKPGEVVRTAAHTLEDALDQTLRPVAQALMSQLAELKPQEAEISLGLKLSAEAGVVISKVAGEASITVKLTWQESEQSQSSP